MIRNSIQRKVLGGRGKFQSDKRDVGGEAAINESPLVIKSVRHIQVVNVMHLKSRKIKWLKVGSQNSQPPEPKILQTSALRQSKFYVTFKMTFEENHILTEKNA